MKNYVIAIVIVAALIWGTGRYFFSNDSGSMLTGSDDNSKTTVIMNKDGLNQRKISANNNQQTAENNDNAEGVEEDQTETNIRADDADIEDFMSSFEDIWVNAVKEKDFSVAEKLFLKDSVILKQQKKLFGELTSQDATLEVISLDISEINETTSNHYEVSIVKTLSTTINGKKTTKVNYELFKVVLEDTYYVYEISDNSPVG